MKFFHTRLAAHGVHLARGDGAGSIEQAVGERGLAVVDVGDNAEVADVVLVHRFRLQGQGAWGQWEFVWREAGCGGALTLDLRS